MALQRDPLTFKRLKALSMRKRLDVVSSNDSAPGLFSMLTPTDLALLFPTYYKRILPDVAGFRAAISKQSAEQQAAAQGSLLQRLSAVEATAGGASLGAAGGGAYTRAGGAGLGARPSAQLTTEQMAAWNKLQQGTLDINSPEGKIFGKLSEAQLASLGISKGKSNTGTDVYQYQQPQVTQEEAVGRLQTAADFGGKSKFSNADAARLIRSVGGSPEEAANLGALVHQESAGLPWKRNFTPSTGDDSYGLWQINMLGNLREKRLREFARFGVRSEEDLKNPVINAKIALHMYRAKAAAGRPPMEDWGAWKVAYGRGGNDYWRQQFALSQQGAYAGGSVEKPQGAGGKYSNEQINKMMEQIKTEKNDQRRQDLANILQSAGVSTATVQSSMQDSKAAESLISRFSGQAFANAKGHTECATFAQAHGVGHTSGWSPGNKLMDGNLRPGDWIARFGEGGRYTNRSGSAHTAMFVGYEKDSAGNITGVKVLDQWNKRGRVGESVWRPGQGGEMDPSAYHQIIDRGNPASMNRVVAGMDQEPPKVQQTQLTESQIPPSTPDEIAIANQREENYRPSMAGEPPEAPPPIPTTGPTAEVMKQEGLNPQAVQDIQAQQAGVPPAAPTATPVAPKVSSGSYQLNMKAFREAVKNDPSNTYPGWMIDMASDQDIIDGFNKDARVKAAGVNIADGKLTVKDMSNPEVKAVIEGAQKSGALKAIDQPKPKPEAPKPAEQPKPTAVVEQPKPTAVVEQRTSRAGEAPEATPPAPPMPAPKPVEGYSDGGSFMAPDTMNLYKVDKQDDIVAINPQTQQPIATMQSGETLSRGDNRVDVTPQPKSNDAGPLPDTTTKQLTNLVSTVSDALSNVGSQSAPIPKMAPDAPTDHPNLIADTNRMIANQQKFSPSYDRAMHRISRGTEPTGSFDHFSYGNK